jgi:hypothetical protein
MSTNANHKPETFDEVLARLTDLVEVAQDLAEGIEGYVDEWTSEPTGACGHSQPISRSPERADVASERK